MYWHHNRQGADIVLEAPKHDPLIKWPIWGHMNVWKIYISIFMRFISNKLGRLLTLGRIFITQTFKSSPNSCYDWFWNFCLSCWMKWWHGNNYYFVFNFRWERKKACNQYLIIHVRDLFYGMSYFFCSLLVTALRIAHNVLRSLWKRRMLMASHKIGQAETSSDFFSRGMRVREGKKSQLSHQVVPAVVSEIIKMFIIVY